MLTQLTDTLTNLITNLYVSTGLIGILLAMAIESCCIPLPSEIVMPLAGLMIASHKLLAGTNSIAALILVALAGAIGCLIGSIAAYGIGYSGGRPLMLKYGRYLLISQHDADKADAFFQRWGSATAFFSRLLPVVRTYISLPAGIAKMPFGKFCVYTVLGSFPWCLLLAYIGTILGNHLDTLSPIFHSLDVVIVIAVVVLLALYIWRHIRNDRKAREAFALEEAAAIRQAEEHPLHSQQTWNQQNAQPFQQFPQQQNWGQNALSQPPQSPQSPQQFQQSRQFQQQGWAQPSQPSQPPQSQQSPQQPDQNWQPQQPPQFPQQPWTGDSDRTVRRG